MVVAAIGASAIAIVSMGLAHGFNVRTGVALIGTLVALIITTLLGGLFTGIMNFTGVATDDAAYLYAVSGNVLDLRGLLLAGLVIGAAAAWFLRPSPAPGIAVSYTTLSSRRGTVTNARFTGDDPGTDTYERWDPMLSGGTGEQWVQGASHFKVVQDSNVIAHRVQARTARCWVSRTPCSRTACTASTTSWSVRALIYRT